MGMKSLPLATQIDLGKGRTQSTKEAKTAEKREAERLIASNPGPR